MLGTVVSAALCLVSPGPPRVDGEFAEWSAATLLATDPAGDASGPLDVLALHGAARGTDLFVAFDLANTVNLQSGPTSNPTLRLVVTAGPRSIAVDFRGRKAYLDGNASNVVTWPSIDYASQPTFASARHELRVDLAAIGVVQGGSVAINFSGADALASPVAFTLNEPPADSVRRSALPGRCTEFRVASLNTLFSGLIDGSRQPEFARLLDAVNADVYCFQEEYDSTGAQIAAFLNSADPRDSGLPWNVVKSGDLAIASQAQLLPFSMGASHYGAVVRLAPGREVLVVTNHPKCCGYTGSSEDSQRISQAQTAIAALAQFRAGALGGTLAPFKHVPAVLVGDWNLVGSSTPLSLWLAQPAPAMTRLDMPQFIGDDIATWYAPSGLDFWPGVLDLLVYDHGALFPKNAFVLDSARLNAAELSLLGLQSADSRASDHLLLVADFGRLPSADYNGDTFVDGIDSDGFNNDFDAGSPAADMNGDGFTDGIDSDLFNNAFDAGC